MLQQTTSTIVTLGNSMSNYAWGVVTGLFFDGGMLLFFTVLVILLGVVTIGAKAFKKVTK